MSDYEIRPAKEGDETVRLLVSLTGTPAETAKAAKALAQSLKHSGARFVVEKRQMSADELGLYSGEHRSPGS